jgi:predicted aspartyl protease
MDIGKCWDFKDDEQPPYPVVEITLSSADRRVAIMPKVDTGFDGLVAVDRETVRRLHLTPKGTVLIRTARGYREAPIYPVNLSQLDLGVTYKTLAIGTERSLLGRRFLENKTWLLECKAMHGRFCIVTRITGSEA